MAENNLEDILIKATQYLVLKELRLQPHNIIINNYYRKDFSLLYEQQLYNRMIESKHIYEPDPNSLYRLAIKNISEDIADKLINDSEQFTEVFTHKDDQTEAIVFQYDQTNFLKNVPIFQSLDIYVQFDDLSNNEDVKGIALIPEYDNIIDVYKPTYESENGIITHASLLLIFNYELDIAGLKYDIENALSHELLHILDMLWNSYYINTSLNINSVRDQLLQKYPISNKDSILTNKNQFQTLTFYVFLISEILYYTQETEQHAYIESIIANMKDTNFYIKRKEQFKNDRFQNYLRNASTTFKYVETLYDILQSIIKLGENKLGWNKYLKDIQYIEKLLNKLPYGKTGWKLFDYFKYWQKELHDFLIKGEEAAYHYSSTYLEPDTQRESKLETYKRLHGYTPNNPGRLL